MLRDIDIIIRELTAEDKWHPEVNFEMWIKDHPRTYANFDRRSHLGPHIKNLMESACAWKKCDCAVRYPQGWAPLIRKGN